jgi:hypothetical protein
MSATINTGSVKPLLIDGKVTIKVRKVTPDEYVATPYLASFYGWHFANTVGGGNTQDEAIAHLCKLTGNDLATVLASCEVIGD